MEELRRLLRAAIPESESEAAEASAEAPAAGEESGAGEREFTADEMMERAEELEETGRCRRSALAYLYVVDRFRHSGRPEVLGRALSRLAALCSKYERFEEALRFRAAERLVYETRLLALAVAEASVPSAGGEEARLRVSARLIGPHGVDALSEEAVASAWERVAEEFFNDGQVELAKRYACRAIHIRRSLAERKADEKTRAGAELASLGRATYEDTLRKFRGAALPEGAAPEGAEDDAEKAADAAPPAEGDVKTAAAATSATTSKLAAAGAALAAAALAAWLQ